MRCLVLGATGFVGRHFVPVLLGQGHRVRALVRDLRKVGSAPWRDDVDLVRGNALNHDDVARALAGVDVVFYLVHSLGCRDFVERDRTAARITAAAAGSAGVDRIVYLGAVRPNESPASSHLHSRAEVGDIFLHGVVPALVLQASIVVGAGSVSYEILRAFARRIPFLPRGIGSRHVQPIAIGDVLHYLAAAGNLEPRLNRAFDIGGPDRMTYADLLQRCASLIGCRAKLPLPFRMTRTWLPAALATLLCPVPGTMARALFESLRNDAVCAGEDGAGFLLDPGRVRTTFDHAVLLAEQTRGNRAQPTYESLPGMSRLSTSD